MKRDSKTFYALLGAWKRLFSRSPIRSKILSKARKEKVRKKKDGSISKRPNVVYLCNICKKYHKLSDIQVDHIKPVIPLNRPALSMSFDEIAERLFCSEDNLQVLCKKCHKKKSKEENNIRKELKKELKESNG